MHPSPEIRISPTARPSSPPIYRGDRVTGWLRDHDNALWLVLAIAHLVPIWAFHYFPTQDGPSHVANARVIWEYDRPDRAILRHFYTLNTQPEPNLLGHLILVSSMAVLPPVAAEKVLLSLYVLLFCFAARYAFGAARREAGLVALLAFPFVYSYTVHMGFYNFALSVPMYLFVVGFWLRHQDRFGIRRAVQFSALLLLLYFSHLVSLLLAGIAVGTTILWGAALEASDNAQQPGRGRFWRTVASRSTAPLLAALPSLVLVAHFVARNASGPSSAFPPKSFAERMLRFVVGEGLIAYSRTEALVSVLVNLLFAGSVAWLIVRRRRTGEGPNRWDGLAVLTLGHIALYLLIPDEALGGGYIKPRLYLYIYLAALLWFSAQSFGQSARRWLRVAALATTGCLFAVRWSAYDRLSRLNAEFVSTMKFIEPGTTLLPVVFTPRGRTADGRDISFRIRPLLKTGGYIAAQKPVVLLDNHEANAGYFPVLYRPELNPYRHIGKLETPAESSWDFLTYSARTPGWVDYVLVWGGASAPRANPCVRSIYEQLARDYRLIHRSTQTGAAELYRRVGRPRRPGTPATPVPGRPSTMCGSPG